MNNSLFPTVVFPRSRFFASFFAALFLSSLAQANNLGQFDARSLALGGTGVASANSANAVAHNPALMATPNNNKRFSVIPFALKVDLYDQNEFIDTIDDTETAIDDLDALIDGISGISQVGTCDFNDPDSVCFTNASMGATATQSNITLDLIEDLNKSNAIVNLGVGMAFQFGRTVPVAVIVDGGANLTVGLKFANSDFKELRAYNDAMADGDITGNEFLDLAAEGLVENNNSQLNFTRSTDEDIEMQSMIEIVGAVNYEVGLGFADSFEYRGKDLAVGVTPKIVKVEAVKFHQGVDDDDDLETDDIFGDENIVSKTDFNMDLGVAFTPFTSQPLQVGVVVKNLFSRTYDLKKTPEELDLESRAAGGDVDAQTDLGKFNFAQRLKIEPQLTVGVSYPVLKVVNLMADLDLNEAEILGQSSQNLSLGAEFDLRLIKLQLGYRSVLQGPQDDAVTAGLTLGPLDLAVVYAGDNIGAVVQTSFSF